MATERDNGEVTPEQLARIRQLVRERHGETTLVRSLFDDERRLAFVHPPAHEDDELAWLALVDCLTGARCEDGRMLLPRGDDWQVLGQDTLLDLEDVRRLLAAGRWRVSGYLLAQLTAEGGGNGD